MKKKMVNKKEYRKTKREQELKKCAEWSNYYFGGNGKIPF